MNRDEISAVFVDDAATAIAVVEAVKSAVNEWNRECSGWHNDIVISFGWPVCAVSFKPEYDRPAFVGRADNVVDAAKALCELLWADIADARAA